MCSFSCSTRLALFMVTKTHSQSGLRSQDYSITSIKWTHAYFYIFKICEVLLKNFTLNFRSANYWLIYILIVPYALWHLGNIDRVLLTAKKQNILAMGIGISWLWPKKFRIWGWIFTIKMNKICWIRHNVISHVMHNTLIFRIFKNPVIDYRDNYATEFDRLIPWYRTGNQDKLKRLHDRIENAKKRNKETPEADSKWEVNDYLVILCTHALKIILAGVGE